jgi:hypothetical protein
MRFPYAVAVALFILVAPLPVLKAFEPHQEDEDCARHCPPPNDDPDCDGGPQPDKAGKS